MAAFITINGMEFPPPARGLELIVATNVDSGRNANGEVIGQRVGRDIYKVNNMVWPWLSAETWGKMLTQFKGFFFTAKIPDMVNGGFITLKMYPGDRTAEPFWIDVKGDKKVLWYKDCKVNIIDCGVI